MFKLSRRALTVLVACVGLLAPVLIAPPAAEAAPSACYTNGRPRAGASTWTPTWMQVQTHELGDVNLPDGTGPYGLHEIIWQFSWDTQFNSQGPAWFAGNTNDPCNTRGIEFDFHNDGCYFAADYYLGGQANWGNLPGSAAPYVDSLFGDTCGGNDLHPGFGIRHPEFLSDNTVYTVSLKVYGTLTGKLGTGGTELKWTVSAMSRWDDHQCDPFGDSVCEFPDFDHTVWRGNWNGAAGSDWVQKSMFLNRFPGSASGKVQSKPTPNVAGTGCSTYSYGSMPINSTGAGPLCLYNYTGSSDSWPVGGFPLDYVEGQSDMNLNLHNVNGDIPDILWAEFSPPNLPQTSRTMPTAEAAFKCNTPEAGQATCQPVLSLHGISTLGNPDEWRTAQLSVPADGYWYLCRVDSNHRGVDANGVPVTSDGTFTYSKSRVIWRLDNYDQNIQVDHLFFGNKTSYGSIQPIQPGNLGPGPLSGQPQCTRIYY